jgi:2-dehydro-3-deoxyphosphooctonate aldolase (KDO 8-P synthase)
MSARPTSKRSGSKAAAAPRPGEPVRLGNIRIGRGCPLVLIAGPCVIESEASALRHAKHLKKLADRMGVQLIFKSSYDKANRTSVAAFRGSGMKSGLQVLARIKKELGIPVTSDIHSPEEAEAAAAVVDVLQIPAFLCRQTDLLIAAGRTGNVVNIKKGQFMAPEDMKHAVDKVRSTGNHRILLTERGTSFGYRTLVNDFRAIPLMRELGVPVIFDATHSVQRPGGLGHATGGDRRFAPMLACAATVAGVDGIFMEVHENPDKALSDGPNSLPLEWLPGLWKRLQLLSGVSCRVDSDR